MTELYAVVIIIGLSVYKYISTFYKKIRYSQKIIHKTFSGRGPYNGWRSVNNHSQYPVGANHYSPGKMYRPEKKCFKQKNITNY